MYVSAATMLDVDVAEPGEHAYTEIVDALRMHGAAPQADTEETWRRIAFSILITDVDDHLRNHGFLHVDRGQWRLAPAFDVNPFPDPGLSQRNGCPIVSSNFEHSRHP